MKKNTFIPEAMRGVCFECGARGHFGRDCPVRKANDGRRGKKRVRFNPEEDVQEAAEPDEGLEPRTAMDGDVDDDDDEDDDVPVRAMKDEVEGEENDTGERYNEVGERIEPFNLRAERANDGFFDANERQLRVEARRRGARTPGSRPWTRPPRRRRWARRWRVLRRWRRATATRSPRESLLS